MRGLERMQVCPVKGGESCASRVEMLRLTNQCTARSGSTEGIHLIVSMRETPIQHNRRVKICFKKNGDKEPEDRDKKKKAKTSGKEVAPRDDEERPEDKSFQVAWNNALSDFGGDELDKVEDGESLVRNLFNKIRVFTSMPAFKTNHGLAHADTVPFSSCFQAALDGIKAECRTGRVVPVFLFILPTILHFSCVY